MKLDAKVKGGLAWAGLAVILAVPAADLLLGKPAEATARTAIVSDTKRVEPVIPAIKPVIPATKPAGLTDPVTTAGIDSSDPVQRLLAKGKKLPSYISDADQAPVAKPVAVQAPAAKPAAPATVNPPVEVASVAPVDLTPPVPLPRSARPHPAVVASAPAGEQPLIIDEDAQATATRGQLEPIPLSDGSDAEPVVTGDQLDEWDSGSLADYLKRKGLLSDNGQQVQVQRDDSSDPDSFIIYDGSTARHVRRLGRADSFFLF